jgi:hypothetical protein
LTNKNEQQATTSELFDFDSRLTKKRLLVFAKLLNDLQEKIGFKVSSRGWCYLMAQAGYIDKSQFDRVDAAIKRCRVKGILPVDFVAADASRAFYGIEIPSSGGMSSVISLMLDQILVGYEWYTPDWWEGEDFYIQCLVEKIDLKTMFTPVCEEYHIPIANAAGWQSILQRAEYAKRFSEAQARGLHCVLLYCGDHDPDGLRISETMRENLRQLADVRWRDGVEGFDPKNLTIERFGLNYDFIIKNDYSWIENLVTGAKLGATKSGVNDLSNPKHTNHYLPYVQNYLRDYGARKCEANATVTTPVIARQLMRDTIENYLGHDALNRFEGKRSVIQAKYELQLRELDIPADIEMIKRKL